MRQPRTWEANLGGSLKDEAIADCRVNFRLALDTVWDSLSTNLKKDWRGDGLMSVEVVSTLYSHMCWQTTTTSKQKWSYKVTRMSIFLFFWPCAHEFDLAYTVSCSRGWLFPERGRLLCMGCEERWMLCVSGCQGGGCLSVLGFLKDAEISLFLSTGTWGK